MNRTENLNLNLKYKEVLSEEKHCLIQHKIIKQLMRELFRTLGLSQINSNNLKDYISYMRKSIRVSKQI